VTAPAVQIATTPHGVVSYTDTGSGDARVMLHSLLTDRAAFDSVSGLLGGRVISIDLPGFGETDRVEADIDDYAHLIGAFLETLEVPPREITLVGNGLGAFVALGTAIHHGGTFDRLLLVGCGARFPDPAKTAFENMVGLVQEGGMEAVIPVALRRIFTEDYLEEHPDMAEERAAVLRRTDPKAFVTACEALRGLDYAAAAVGVNNPTMITVGEEDQATPPAMAEELHALIAESSLVRMPGLAHAPHLQSPGDLAAVVRPFLEGR
jgi:3-oxoadipate enol-lactonase